MWDFLVVNPMTNILLTIYSVVGNFGVAIILFTILIRLLTHPLMAQQIKSSTKMQEINNSKKYKDMQEKYKGDKEKLAAEQMKMYQELGYNPLGGCLPTLIQFPIIIGLYQSITRALATSPYSLLKLSRTVYGALSDIFPSLSLNHLIPINNHFLGMNLAQPEWSTIFGIGIPILAVIVALTTYVQSKLTTPPSTDPQASQMSSMMTIYMPLLLGYFALNFASGLAVYFIVSNLFGIGQYAVLGKVDWKNLFRFGSPKAVVTTSGKKKS
jgi:YidC/Oxa1 family membrane protein insertase